MNPEPEQKSAYVRLTQVRALGFFGTIMALLTMAAAFGFGFLMLFGTTVAAALLTYFIWPHVFSPEFSQWVFGAGRAPFWKLFLLFLALGAVVKMFRPLRK